MNIVKHANHNNFFHPLRGPKKWKPIAINMEPIDMEPIK